MQTNEEAKAMRSRVVIIEDYQVLLESYKQIIEGSKEFSVAGTFTNCEDFLLQIDKLRPDFVLVDIALPGMSGIEGIRHIKSKLGEEVAIMVVTVHENSKYVFEALCAGAVGYLTKSSGEKRLLSALHQLKSGGAPMSVNIARMVVESFQQRKFDELTERENRVLALLANGESYASIAESLFVSLNTIKYHVRNIYEKLHISSKKEAMELFQLRNSDKKNEYYFVERKLLDTISLK